VNLTIPLLIQQKH